MSPLLEVAIGNRLRGPCRRCALDCIVSSPDESTAARDVCHASRHPHRVRAGVVRRRLFSFSGSAHTITTLHHSAKNTDVTRRALGTEVFRPEVTYLDIIVLSLIDRALGLDTLLSFISNMRMMC